MSLIATTATRVSRNTAPDINRTIRLDMERRVEDVRAQGNEAIQRRLDELEREWDIERCLEMGASSLVLTGALLALTKNRAWLVLPIGVAAFLLQHAIQGWCPPLPALRRLGIRTADEINEERIALKVARGDFYEVSSHSLSTVAQVVRAVRR